jgi:hypothetical protein
LLVFLTRRVVAETIKVPQMADSLSEGTLKRWAKQVGDSVVMDEEVASVETDKVRSLPLTRTHACAIVYGGEMV